MIVLEWLATLLPMVAYVALGLCVVKAMDELTRRIEKRGNHRGKGVHEH